MTKRKERLAHEATKREAVTTIARLEAENARLREALDAIVQSYGSRAKRAIAQAALAAAQPASTEPGP